MRGRDIIKTIMERNGVSNTDLAEKLKIKPTALWDRLNTKKAKDIPVSTMTEMLRPLEHKVIVVPESTETPQDGFEVD